MRTLGQISNTNTGNEDKWIQRGPLDSPTNEKHLVSPDAMRHLVSKYKMESNKGGHFIYTFGLHIHKHTGKNVFTYTDMRKHTNKIIQI